MLYVDFELSMSVHFQGTPIGLHELELFAMPVDGHRDI